VKAGAAARIAGVALAAALATPVVAQGTLSGVWEAVRVNQQALPMTDRVVGKDGSTHVVRLHSMIIRLRPNGRFQAALRYQRAILSKGEKVETQPLLNDTWSGPYTITGTHMRFDPEKQGDQKVQPFTGEINGRRITVTFDYEIVTRKHYVLDLDRNDRIL
jgi:hypothetical protein